MKPEQLLEKVKANVRFPRHGWAVDSDNCYYLLFPILRVGWEHVPWESQEPIPCSRLSEWERMSYFQRGFFRILFVLEQIVREEKLLLSRSHRDGTRIQEWARARQAEHLLPVFTDYFYISLRVLADRLVEAVRPVVVANQSSFPRDYRKLLTTAEKGRIPDWKWKVDPGAFLRAIRENRDWFVRLTGEDKDAESGIRKSIVHRLAESVVVREVDQYGKMRRVMVQFQAADRDVPKRDILSEIPRVVGSFCDCLSALPPELWSERDFTMADLVLRADRGWPVFTRFFPSVDLGWNQ